MSNFHVGQKVVCVDDAEPDFTPDDAIIHGGMDGLRRGAVYTVRSIFIDPYYKQVCVRLTEIERKPYSRHDGIVYESGFAPERFRPVVERKTDIGIFTAMLEPKKARVDA